MINKSKNIILIYKWKYLCNVMKSLLISLYFIYILIYFKNRKKYKRIGIIGLAHSQNIGNNLLKYAIYIKLHEFGLDPYIIGKRKDKQNISFILNNAKVRIINKTFNEIQKKDYDILMVNSDQTWRRQKDFLNIGFLNFSKNWDIPKFVYGASLGIEKWKYTKKEDKIIKSLIKNFNGISIREKGSIKNIEIHLGVKPILVLDPTLLINKKYYMNLIKNFKIDNIIEYNFIFVYTLTYSKELKNLIKNLSEIYNYQIYLIDINVINNIQKFIYGIYKSKAVITDSFHGTIFSIIFNKPFLSFVNDFRGNERFNSLKEIFNVSNRILYKNYKPDINLLEEPLKINKKYIKYLKKKSIKFLKYNLFFS